MELVNDFEELIQEIHRVNKGWHCFLTCNRFLNVKNKYLQAHYLKEKNRLQDKLMQEYGEMIELAPIDTTGFPSIKIKTEYQFSGYKDACHIKKEKDIEND